MANAEGTNYNFIEEIIANDIEKGVIKAPVTRFPPEPNGYLHIGHAKSICLNFGLAEQFGGECNLRFDDTNPAKEETEYVESIMNDVKWLGFEWKNLCHASDYFDQFYEWALDLIKAGKAYVDDQSAEEIRQNRGTLTKPGVESPYRNRTPEENLDLFSRMTAGEFEEGSRVLRAKIDMSSSNMNMRDPVMYRILKRDHYRTGDKWCVYPMYDYAHGYEDAIEGITHSVCTLEFQDHRPLYDWFIDNVNVPHVPHQYEFARLNLTYTVMSKRRLLELVTSKIVNGWDDPRMPTISGFRRRGYTPESIRRFCKEIGVSKADSMVEIELLQHFLREELNKTALRAMAVLRPLKVVLTNWPEGFVDELPADNNPEDESAGSRTIKIGREIYIDREDFMEEPVKGFFRLAPGQEVRLKHAYIIRCTDVVRDAAGEISELHCTVDMDSRGGDAPDGRKIKGTLHWVWSGDAVRAKVNLYGHLFTLRNMNDMEEGKDYKDYLNPESLAVMENALVEPFLANAKPLDKFQFLRQGYFCADYEMTPERPVFNLTVSLKDSWGKELKKQ
ncbi:glutamine--tRNA ligase/YqeY domain fusion protein [Synergistaceae bacterium OttesenSCG-928-D05]|nr:glutamine--tRNA ligase/YqeY domain fusion protein [Synergistaceae bacterium OttesenSCG-928-D05]